MGSFLMMGAGLVWGVFPMRGQKPGTARRIFGGLLFVLGFGVFALGAYTRGVHSGAF